MKILVDHRERGQIPNIKRVCDEIETVHLPLGDYLIPSETGAVLVERKTVRDFLYSIRSNRLWDQLLRFMKRREILGFNLKRRLLLIHGELSYLPDALSGFDMEYSERDHLVFWSQIMGAFLEILYVYDTPIIVAENDTAFRAFLRILIKREGEGQNDKLPTARWYRKRARADLPVKDKKRFLLSSIPSIGEILAGNLLTYFDTVSDIANASTEELQKVPKIGKRKAELIYQIFHT